MSPACPMTVAARIGLIPTMSVRVVGEAVTASTMRPSTSASCRVGLA
jgi:hypothetical protein